LQDAEKVAKGFSAAARCKCYFVQG
jgi:hypothetical protein